VTSRWVRPETNGPAFRVLGYLIAAAGLALTWYFFSTLFLPNNLIGNDGVTYLAAAERLNAGHQLYAIVPGDRYVFGYGSPCCPYALMSPPPIAVLWRPLMVLGPVLALLVWDWINALAVIATVGLMLVRRPLPTGLLIVGLSLPLAMETLLGNVNGLLVAGIAATWLLGRSGRYGAAGALIGLMAAIKLWPALLLVWFISQRRFDAVKGFVVGAAVVGVISVVGAGLGAHIEYLTTVAPAGAGLTSLADIVQAATGVRIPWIAYAVLVFGTIETIALRSQPRLAWGAIVLTLVFGSPVFHVGTLILLFGAIVPWMDRGQDSGEAIAQVRLEPTAP
jgi:hypothetical protein